MLGTAHTVVVHAGEQNIWSVFLALAITGGVAGIALVAGVATWLIRREEHGRPVIPWGARMRVERAKAHTEITAEHLKQDAVEIKRIALGAQREAVLKAVEDGDMPTVMQLGLPPGDNGRVEDGRWIPASP